MIGTLTIAMAMQAAAPADYAMPQNWICYPGRRDVCSEANYDTTVMASGADPSVSTYAAATEPAADCFYVYPTVSRDEGGNSDLVINAEERSVTLAQFARFGSECRLFAPLYQQITLTALRSMLSGGQTSIDRDLAYGDVRNAFRHYMEHENQGRPFVLYGHSQGAGMLKRLVAEEVDGKPIQQQMLSAMLIGTNVGVPAGRRTGGDFKSVETCSSASDTGCLVSFVTFREDDAPDANTRFGRWNGDEGWQVVCTNPANLADGSSAPLNATFWVDANPEVEAGTGYVTTADLIRGRCVNAGGVSYFSIGTDDTARSALYEGLLISTRNMPGWGLHMVDTNVAQDDLISLVASQTEAWSGN